MFPSHSSVVLWTEKEITPSSILLTTSGSNGNRLLFWCPAPTRRADTAAPPPTTDAPASTTLPEADPPSADRHRLNASSDAGKGEHFRRNPSALNISTCSTHHMNTSGSLVGASPFGTPAQPEHTVRSTHVCISSPGLDVFPCSSGPQGAGFRSANTLMGFDGIPASMVSCSVMGTHGHTITTSSPLCGASSMFHTGDTTVRSTSVLTGGQSGPTSSAAVIEGLPVNVLLSLLHGQSQELLQRKVYLKLDRRVFVGASFNLAPEDDELAYRASPPGSPEGVLQGGSTSAEPAAASSHSPTNSSSSSSCNSASMVLSFSVVFVLDALAPPSVLSHYTELARLTGAQIRRTELVHHYLSHQYKTISNILDNTGSSSSPSLYSPAGHGQPLTANPALSSNASAAPVRVRDRSVLDRSLPTVSKAGGLRSPLPPSSTSALLSCPPSTKKFLRFGASPLEAAHINPASESVQAQQAAKSAAQDVTLTSPLDSEMSMSQTTFDRRRLTLRETLLEASSLCRELKAILDSVCQVGHVVVLINKVYPVCFCLPHKAYCLDREAPPYRLHPTGQLVLPAIRPQAVWRAMDGIRPYHTVLLVTPKQELFARFLPRVLGVTMVDVINELSPSLSLESVSIRLIASTRHCLSTALWLVYHGHGIIIYPVVASNTYVMTAPRLVVGNGSSPWLTGPMIAEFAVRFPELNLAEVLSSFSIGLHLKEHQNPGSAETDYHNKLDDLVGGGGSPSDEGEHKQPMDKFGQGPWHRLPTAEQIQLISWLLGRRLIVQIHVYVFATLHHTTDWMLWSKKHANVYRQQQAHHQKALSFFGSTGSSPTSELSDDPSAATPTASGITRLDPQLTMDLPENLINRLKGALPIDQRDTLLTVILSHPGVESTRNYYRRNPHLLLQQGPSELHIPLQSGLSQYDVLDDVSEPFHLFVKLLPRLPAHFEELMYTHNVSRTVLIQCVERFYPLLSTVRLPDPVTACFTGTA